MCKGLYRRLYVFGLTDLDRQDLLWGPSRRSRSSALRFTWRPRGLSKSVMSRIIIRVTPFRVLITLLITHLLSPVGLQVGFRV